eukprot:COSAG02_NODE_94_length_37427_cov_79.161728_14_plen_244_part_00
MSCLTTDLRDTTVPTVVRAGCDLESMRVPDELLRFAHELADLSGEKIRPHFRVAAVVRSKDSHTEYPDVVTEADLSAEKAMRGLIEARYPTHGILGEEFGSVRLESDWVWVLDPVDGTRDFATGTLTWGTLIGLCFRSAPVLGVIDQPVAGDRWLGAHGHPTTYNGTPITYSHDGDVPCTLADSRCVVSGAGFGALGDEGYISAATALVAAVTTTSFTVNAYAYGLLALGSIELAFEAPGTRY